MGKSATQIILVVTMLVTGSVNTISKKMGYATKARGLHGDVHDFEKPWTQSLVMFFGEFMCLGVFFWNRWRAAAAAPAGSLQAPLDGGRAEAPHLRVTARDSLVCFLPCCCDVLGTTFSGIGLLWVDASVFQMMRGSIILWTGAFSMVFLKKKMYGFNFLGVFVVVLGVTLVGVSSLFAPSGDTTKKGSVGLGIVLIVLSQIMSATQMVVEEVFVKGRELPPEFVVGCEGMFGMLVMLCVVLPTVYHLPGADGQGVHENAIDAAAMVAHSRTLLLLVGAYWVSISFFNFASLSVTKHLSAVHRTLVDTCRTAVVWTVELTIYYGFGHSKYGEPWDKTSVLQLVGFAIMAVGTFTYYRVFDWPVAALYPPADKPEPEVLYEPLADGENDARNPLPMTARRDDARDV